MFEFCGAMFNEGESLNVVFECEDILNVEFESEESLCVVFECVVFGYVDVWWDAGEDAEAFIYTSMLVHIITLVL